jgi:hypothetical protein
VREFIKVLEWKNLKKNCEVSKWWDEKSAKLCERTHKSGGMKKEQNCVRELIRVLG